MSNEDKNKAKIDQKEQQPPQEQEDKKVPDKPGGMPPMKFGKGGLSWLIFLGLALALVALLSKSYQKKTKLTITQFYTYLENRQIEQVTVKDGTVVGKLRSMTGQKPGSSSEFEVQFPRETTHAPEFIEQIRTKCNAAETPMDYQTSDNIFIQVFLPLIPWLLIFGFIWFFVFRQIRNSAGGAGMLGSFGRSRHRLVSKERTEVTFEHVAGIDEAKEEVQEIIEFLKNPKKFQKLGGRIPRGVLLIGEPGCGKTLLAKAIAGEADVPFYSISGSDFVEMFVGVGASRVRDLFSQAKANSPCIIFLDEIDAVGRKRGAGFNGGGGHDEREQTLNAILVEIDGFDSSDQVIVIAATNRGDVLDPALTRPGRFDRQIYVPLPDIKGRFEILKVHAKNVKIDPDIDFWRVARGTPMFSGADLAAIINEAAISATMADKDHVELEDMEEARDKVRWGRAKKSRVIDEKEQEVIAYHEAGHALTTELFEGADPLHKVSIIPRGQAGGMTMMLPETDRHVYTRSYVSTQLKVLIGGRVAEEIACGDTSSGASDDIKRASQLARTMVCEWGMSSEIGPIRLGPEHSSPWPVDMGGKDYSEQTAQVIDREVSKLVRDAYDKVKNKLTENKDKLDVLAKALLKHETIEADEVKMILEGKSIDKPTVNDLLKGEASKQADDKSEEKE